MKLYTMYLKPPTTLNLYLITPTTPTKYLITPTTLTSISIHPFSITLIQYNCSTCNHIFTPTSSTSKHKHITLSHCNHCNNIYGINQVTCSHTCTCFTWVMSDMSVKFSLTTDLPVLYPILHNCTPLYTQYVQYTHAHIAHAQYKPLYIHELITHTSYIMTKN